MMVPKRWASLIVGLFSLFFVAMTVLADAPPQDQFLQIYFQLQEADRLERNEQYASARDKYKSIADQLDALKKNHPEWEPSIINFRIKYARDKIAELATKTDKTPAKPSTPPSAPAPAPSPATTATTTSTSTQTSAIAGLTNGSSTAASASTTAPAGTDMASLQQRVNDLEKELSNTKTQLANALDLAGQLRQRLDAAERELGSVKGANLEERVAGILQENASLKAQLTDAQQRVKDFQAGAQPDSVPMLKEQLKNAQDQLSTLEAENQAFRINTNDLKQQLEAALAKLNAVDKQNGTASFHQENDVLRGILTRQLQEQARRDEAKRLALEEMENLHIQSKVLQQQIDALGSPIITLSADEKALLRINAAQITAPSAAAPSAAAPSAAAQAANNAPVAANAPADDLSQKPKIPEELRPLAQQASDFFAQGKYDQAADVYSKIIEKYPDSLFAWSNLGVVRFQQQHYPEAEKALKQAIQLNPKDAFSYSILGIVYYQQGRYDDAIDALTKASALLPNDPRTHNYLGIAYSQKGWQEAAEKELRKAIELDPSLGDAHFNLAVIYATQKPPAKEMAKKHYQAALSLGIPKDPRLEKILGDAAAAAAPTAPAKG
ncbi:MAG: tetratricopeptide repeat protein [Verrucomicrobium sp.]|nr:tetratricopeptide repeat protein [Verrucomicrobium sp.]